MPRSMFSADGTKLHSSAKSALMDILEKPHVRALTGARDSRCPMKASTIDRMAEVQALEKLNWIKNYSHLTTLLHKYSHTDELRLIFNR